MKVPFIDHVMTVGIIVSVGTVVLFSVQVREEKLRSAYERGAWAVVMHHKYFGDYGSFAYREAAYKWGNPQSKENVETIRRIAEQSGTP